MRPPFSATFDECGGYDCIYGGWAVRDAAGRLVVTVDLGDYGQNGRDEATWAANEAEAHAKFPEAAHIVGVLVAALNDAYPE